MSNTNQGCRKFKGEELPKDKNPGEHKEST